MIFSLFLYLSSLHFFSGFILATELSCAKVSSSVSIRGTATVKASQVKDLYIYDRKLRFLKDIAQLEDEQIDEMREGFEDFVFERFGLNFECADLERETQTKRIRGAKVFPFMLSEDIPLSLQSGISSENGPFLGHGQCERVFEGGFAVVIKEAGFYGGTFGEGCSKPAEVGDLILSSFISPMPGGSHDKLQRRQSFHGYYSAFTSPTDSTPMSASLSLIGLLRRSIPRSIHSKRSLDKRTPKVPRNTLYGSIQLNKEGRSDGSAEISVQYTLEEDESD